MAILVCLCFDDGDCWERVKCYEYVTINPGGVLAILPYVWLRICTYRVETSTPLILARITLPYTCV
eukprot:scaffold6097_cov77-Cylindrotheca_fusiformis.AAC.3